MSWPSSNIWCVRRQVEEIKEEVATAEEKLAAMGGPQLAAALDAVQGEVQAQEAEVEQQVLDFLALTVMPCGSGFFPWCVSRKYDSEAVNFSDQSKSSDVQCRYQLPSTAVCAERFHGVVPPGRQRARRRGH